MFELIKAGGWVMVPIIASSIIAMAIILERFWSLAERRVVPNDLVRQIWNLHRQGQLTPERIQAIRNGSPLGRILAAGLVNRAHPREVMKEAIGEVGRQVVLEMERYLNTLGTIASISPLLGLLGTVFGMIKSFSVITTMGVGNPSVLAGGIAEALITTAAGLSVAIPALIFHRFFTARVDRLAIGMEKEALNMVEVVLGEREANIHEWS